MKRIREQLTCYGGKGLSDEDLLTLILCTGAGGKQRTPRIPHLGSDPLQHLLQADVGQLVHVYGLGKVKAIQLQAVLELARRIMRPLGDTGYQITAPQDAANLVMPDMAYLDHEELRVLVLNTKNVVLANVQMYKGSLDASVLRAAEIFKPAVTRSSASIIVCHNHPSGDPTPSPEDIDVTHQLVEAGKLLDIELLDHLVIGNCHFISLKEQLRW